MRLVTLKGLDNQSAWGNSGGALVDSNGNLLGVINFIESTTGGNQGLNFAIPIDVVSESYSKILKETKR